MLTQFGEATRLIGTNLVLFGSIILTISLPKNLLVNYGSQWYPERAKNIETSAEIFLAPIYIAALIYALSRLKQGYLPRYSEIMAIAFRKWQKLLLARFVAWLLILVGLLALIIPGIALFVRYSLLDPVVVLEGAGVSEAIRRSAKLTIGVRWQIFAAWLLCFVAVFVLALLISLAVVLFPQLDTAATRLLSVCALDCALAIPQTVMFLYYWEAATNERLQIEPPPVEREGPTLG